ncbi:MAG: FAD-dependent oxidoreductase [Rhodothermia bacterium]|nr:MAG: FAD-dependent oxidoreductase [Rhodothermia bacterium]
MDKKYDVVVVGGGVIGLCSAYYLRLSGASVVVLDKSDFSDGASWVNAGLLVPSHLEPIAAPGVIAQGLKWLADPESPFYIKPRIDMELTRWLWGFQAACTKKNVERAIPVLRDLAFASLELHDELAKLPGFENTGFKHGGLLMLHNSLKSEKANLALADLAETTGLMVERLSESETHELDSGIKTPMKGSVLFREDCTLDPEQFMRALIRQLKADGVHFFSQTEVTDFDSDSDRISTVKTKNKPVAADHVVLCAGSWSGLLGNKLGIRLPIQPATGYSITIENPSSQLRIPVVVTDEKVAVIPMAGRLRIGGTLTLVGFDEKIDTRRTIPLQRQARLYCPEFSTDDTPLPATRSGFRPCTIDGLPAIGKADEWKNVIVASGHGMLGMTQGPITGQIVADLVAGTQPSVDISSLNPNRF